MSALRPSSSLATFPTISRLKWGRELTVGCPVVVSPLPREWSCLYRRGHPPKSFRYFQQYVALPSAHRLVVIAEARDAARKILLRVRGGLPAVTPKDDTFGTVVNNWRKRHVEANGLISAPEINRLLDQHILPAWKDRPFTSIRRTDITALLDKVEDGHGARAADYVLNVARSIMFWQAARSDDYSPPIVRGMNRQKTANSDAGSR